MPIKVSIIEDDDWIRENLAAEIRRSEGFICLQTYRSGEEALSKIAQTAVEVVLMDINLPKMNGIEFLREVRADPKLNLTPVIVLTTSNDERDRIEAYNLNVAGYILKPVTFTNFCEVMAALNKYWALVELP